MQLDEIRLETGAGLVPVKLERDGSHRLRPMEQSVPTFEPYADEAALLEGVGVERSELPRRGLRQRPPARLRRASVRAAVAALRPNSRALADLPAVLGINCFAGSGSLWKTRMFAPGNGVPEDPATGSAAGPLAVHLARMATQSVRRRDHPQGAEIGRPSTLFARVEGSSEQVEKVEVGGSAVTVARGEFRLP